MTKRNEIYKCEICGNIIEILHEGAGELVCCNTPMQNIHANTVDAAQEKHLPVITEDTVTIGEIPHPMTADHHIEWIETTDQTNNISKKYLTPTDTPKTSSPSTKIKNARAYCNLHGLWETKN